MIVGFGLLCADLECGIGDIHGSGFASSLFSVFGSDCVWFR